MADKAKIRVMIVDDHDMLRSGLRVFIDTFDDIELVGEASNGERAVELCQQLQPDVVLMDYQMPRMNGIEAITEIKKNQPHIEFIMLTSFVDDSMVERALQAGALGYLLKDAGVDDLHRAVVRAYDGQSVLAPEATQVLVKATVRSPSLGHDLTDREVEILALVAVGKSNSEIGEDLHISRSTVKNHISNIFAKLNTDSRTEAAALAVQYGIVRLDDK